MKVKQKLPTHRMSDEGVCKLGISHPKNLTFLCPEGMKRARWMAENIGASAAEELNAPGCSWFILSEDVDCYCFFKMLDNKDHREFSEDEIAKRLGLSISQVRTIFNRALMKIKGTPFYEEIKDLRDAGELYEADIDEGEDIYYADGGGGFSEGIESSSGEQETATAAAGGG